MAASAVITVPMTTLQDSILDAALPSIVFDGWTMSALEHAATSIGSTTFDAKRAFPGGPLDAINHFFRRADSEMLETLRRDHTLLKLKIRERIATAVMVRLHSQAPHREAIRRALGLYALPWNMATATKSVYATVDAIWREAGDTSTDYNFYTKRLLLAQVYTSTVSVWLNDRTPDLSETEAFLRRRIENVMQIEKFKAKAKDTLGTFESWLPKFGAR